MAEKKVIVANKKINNLKKKELESIKELKIKVLKEFPEVEFILYGSKAKGETGPTFSLGISFNW